MKKISKKTLNKAWARWYFGGHNSLSYQWLETIGFLDSMSPVIKELYGEDKEQEVQALERHCAFYCTEPQLGSVLNGIACGMEEERANGKEVDDEIINGIKVGLMGPLAGIGDSMIPGMLIPLLLSIGIGLAKDGSFLGPLFYICTYVPMITFISRFLFFKGYHMGTAAVDTLVGEMSERIRDAFNLLGGIVVGAVSASYVSVTTILKFKTGSAGSVINIDDTLNGIFPKLLPLLVVLFCWWLMSKKKVSAIKTMLILVVLAIVLVLVGIL